VESVFFGDEVAVVDGADTCTHHVWSVHHQHAPAQQELTELVHTISHRVAIGP
jgi:hypothetical protein